MNPDLLCLCVCATVDGKHTPSGRATGRNSNSQFKRIQRILADHGSAEARVGPSISAGVSGLLEMTGEQENMDDSVKCPAPPAFCLITTRRFFSSFPLFLLPFAPTSLYEARRIAPHVSIDSAAERTNHKHKGQQTKDARSKPQQASVVSHSRSAAQQYSARHHFSPGRSTLIVVFEKQSPLKQSPLAPGFFHILSIDRLSTS